jgi:4-amino-4-deoxy-L-arabinose transferase-like glycosyltransferase
MRLVSALLGALTAACAFLMLRELLPRHPAIAVAGGVLVAFEPMFGFMSGSVNNDMGVNAAGAVLLYLLVRGLRRGLSVGLAIAIGLTLAVAPLMKATGFELWPAAAVGLLGMVWRRRWTPALKQVGIAAAACAALFLVWKVVSPDFHRGTFNTPGGTARGGGYLALHHPFGYLQYLWQVFLPRLPGMHDLWTQHWPAFDIYAVRGWASFGWYAMTFAHWVYQAIALVMLGCGGLTALALWRHRHGATRRLGWEIGVLLASIVGVVGGVHAYYYVQEARSGIIAEMGRYAFPAITALAAAALGGAFFFRRRSWAVPYAAGLAVAVVVLCYSSQLLAIGRFYGLT